MLFSLQQKCLLLSLLQMSCSSASARHIHGNLLVHCSSAAAGSSKKDLFTTGKDSWLQRFKVPRSSSSGLLLLGDEPGAEGEESRQERDRPRVSTVSQYSGKIP